MVRIYITKWRISDKIKVINAIKHVTQKYSLVEINNAIEKGKALEFQDEEGDIIAENLKYEKLSYKKVFSKSSLKTGRKL